MQAARSAADIPGMSLKSAIGEYGNPFLKALPSRSRHMGLCREICCRQCVSNRVPLMATVWERLFESTNYILEVVKLNNIHLFNTPRKRQRTNTS